MLVVFRLVNRLKAIEFLQHQEIGKNKNDNYSLSVVFSADKQFQSQFRAKLVKLVKEAHKRVRQAEPIVLLQLNIDLLEWMG